MHQILCSLRTAILCLLTCLACIGLHESGHAVAGSFAGGHVSEFVLVSETPHVVITGEFSRAQQALDSVAGSALFIVTWFVLAALIPRHRLSIQLEVAGLLVGIELFAWFVSAILYPGGPKNYDGWQFLALTGLPRMYVAGACLGIAGIALLVFRWRTSDKISQVRITTSAPGSGDSTNLLHSL